MSLDVVFCGLLRVVLRVGAVTVGRVSMVGSRLVASRFMMLRSFVMMFGRFGVMFGCFAVMFRRFLRHADCVPFSKDLPHSSALKFLVSIVASILR